MDLNQSQKKEFIESVRNLQLAADVSDRLLADSMGISRTLLRSMLIDSKRLTLFSAFMLLRGFVIALNKIIIEFNQLRSVTPYKPSAKKRRKSTVAEMAK